MDGKDLNKKNRAKKTTREQYIIYLNELESNLFFRENSFNPKENPFKIENDWTKLVAKLNCAGGPIKSIKDWKHAFSDWKCQARKKERENKKSYQETGNKETALIKPLTDLENRLLDLTGRIVTEGMHIPELGVAARPNFEIEENDVETENNPTSTMCKKTASQDKPGCSSQDKPGSSSQDKPGSSSQDKPGSSSQVLLPQKKRKRESLSSTIQDLLKERKENINPTQTNIEISLTKITGILENLVEIETKRFRLQQLKLRFKYRVADNVDLGEDYADEAISEDSEDSVNFP